MTDQDDPRRKSRRELLLILLILPFGVLCMIIAGQAAIRLAPDWALPANMLSNLDPNNNFSGLGDRVLIEPLNPGILTQPVWDRLFMTPNASIPTREVAEISTPAPVRTQPPEIETPERNPSPTSTATLGGPIIPTTIASLRADLSITKTDKSDTYTPGTTVSYTIVVTNKGPDEAEGFHIEDRFPTKITNLTVNCSSSAGATCGVNASSGNTILFRRAAVKVGSQITITVSGLVQSGATGNLSNTAYVRVPPEAPFNDVDGSNNSATDMDTQRSIYDISVTKSDGIDTFTAANTQFDYTVEVSNSGPSDAIGITINDTRPVGITSWGWCVAPCTPDPDASSADFSDTVTIVSGGSIQYSVAATRDTSVVQSISNSANLVIPSGPGVIVEQNPANNSATDINLPLIDLQIDKDDGGTTFAPGGTVDYTVTVTNNSTFDLTGIGVSDPKPTQFTSWQWCVSPPCPAPITTDFTDTFNLAAGGIQVYIVTANVSANPGVGDITNTASVSAPTGLVDQVPGDNSDTETTPPFIDLQITKDDGVATYIPGGNVTYTVVVTNNSAFDLTGISITDSIPPLITTWSWTCVTANPSCDEEINSSSDFADTIDLLAGGSLTYNVAATIHSNAAGTLKNTAYVSPPAGLVDIVPGNDTATDSDLSAVGEPDVGSPDGSVYSIPENTSATFLLSQPVLADGDGAADLVFYELPTVSGIDLDQVVFAISSDGSTWYPVFYWGDDIADTNTNVDINLPNIANACSPPSTEEDNCSIASEDLYNNKGITIDVDNSPLSSVPLGSYYWIRLSAPAGSGDSAHVDAIDILP